MNHPISTLSSSTSAQLAAEVSNEDELRSAVRSRYAALARDADAGCCGGDADDDCGCAAGYLPEDLATLPDDVSGLSLGCGDPVTLAGLQPGERVLDLGSGGGLDAFLAARRVGPGGRVIGVDMTDEMLERAEAARGRLGLEQVEFRQGLLEALPVDDESVDVVMSNCVINLVPDKAAVYREAFRVLAPGGRFTVTDIVADGPFPARLADEPALWTACVAGASQPEQITRMLTAAGFVSIAVDLTASAEDLVPLPDGMPAIHSARITALKPDR